MSDPHVFKEKKKKTGVNFYTIPIRWRQGRSARPSAPVQQDWTLSADTSLASNEPLISAVLPCTTMLSTPFKYCFMGPLL